MKIETCIKAENGERITYFYPANAIYDPTRDGLNVGYTIGLGVGEDGCVKRTVDLGRSGMQYGQDLIINQRDGICSIPLGEFLARWRNHKQPSLQEKAWISDQAQEALVDDVAGYISSKENLAHNDSPPTFVNLEPSSNNWALRNNLAHVLEDNFWNDFSTELRDALITYQKSLKSERHGGIA